MLLSSSILLTATPVTTEIAQKLCGVFTAFFPAWCPVISYPPLLASPSGSQEFPSFSSKRFSPHPHLKEKHTKLKLPSTQIPFPHLCRSRDHVCQARGQACYSCELLQTELKETLYLSLKGMQNILVFGALLFIIVWSILSEERLQAKFNRSYTRQTIISTPTYKWPRWMIQTTGCDLLVIINRSGCLLRMLHFLLWGPSTCQE